GQRGAGRGRSGEGRLARGLQCTRPPASRPMTDVTAVQRRTVTTLVGSQIAGGIGLASGFAVAALAAESLSGSAEMSGLAQTSSVLGSAIAAVPIARLMAARGRRI